MKTQIFLATCCIVGLGFLQGCSESDSDDSPWSSAGELHSNATVASSKISSNSRGDIVVVWEDVEQEIRTDQALTDAHDPAVPYPVDAPISATRDMNPDPDVFEAYDSGNETHRADAKQADYADHESHVHVNVYQRTNVKARVYSASRGSWLTATNLQNGFWQKIQQGTLPDENAGNEQLTITGNVSGLNSVFASTATDSNGNAVAAWIQARESEDAAEAGDVGEGFDIYTSQFSASSASWSAAEKLTLATVGEKPALHDMAVSRDVSGNVQLLWLARDELSAEASSAVRVYHAQYDATAGSWSNSTLLSDSNVSSSAVKVVMFNNNSGVALWTRINESANSTYVEQGSEVDACVATPSICAAFQTNLYAHWFNGDGWQGTPVLISDALGEVGEFELATNRNGATWVVWTQKDSFVSPVTIDGVEQHVHSTPDKAKIVVSQFDETGATWSTPVVVNTIADDNSFDNNKDPAIAMDANGAVMVVWSQETEFSRGDDDSNKWNNSQREAIWGSVFTSTWQSAFLLASDDRASYLQPKIASTGADRFGVVWRAWNVSYAQSGYQLLSLDYGINDTPSQVHTVSGKAEEIEDVFLVSAGGGLKVVWSTDKGLIKTASK